MKKLVMLTFFLPVFAYGQGYEQKARWNTIASVGLFTGQSDTKPGFHLSAGRNQGLFFAGAGAGYETYGFRSMPVYLDLRLMPGRKRVVFFYGNGGYHFAAKFKAPFEFSKIGDELHGGSYLDAGVGYRVPVGRSSRIALSAGYSHKKMSRTKRFSFPCQGGGDCPEDITELSYNFGRLTAKVSWELGY